MKTDQRHSIPDNVLVVLGNGMFSCNSWILLRTMIVLLDLKCFDTVQTQLKKLNKTLNRSEQSICVRLDEVNITFGWMTY